MDESITSRAIGLRELITEANLVPPDRELPDWLTMLSEVDEELLKITPPIGGEITGLAPPARIRRALLLEALAERRWIRNRFPGDDCQLLRTYLRPSRGRGGDLAERYSRLVAAAVTLRAIAQMTKPAPGARVPIRADAQALLTVAELGNRGEIAFRNTDLRNALEGVEADRIRECPVCQKIYWAKRKDKPACSEPCANKRRVRAFRERYLKVYKPRRIAKAEGGGGEEDKSRLDR